MSVKVSSSLLPREDLQLLASMRHGLEASVMPEVSSELGRTICDFAIQCLDKLIIKHTEWPAMLRRQIERQGEILLKAANLLGETEAIDSDFRAAARNLSQRSLQLQGLSLPEVEQTCHEINSALERLIPLLLKRAVREGAGQSGDVSNELLLELSASIRDAEQDFNAASQRRVDAYGAQVEKHVVVTRQSLQDYLQWRLPERKNLEVTSFNELPGGSSKVTILADVRGLESEGVTPLVVRADREAGSTDTKVLNEVSTLRAVWRHGLPVPEVLWVEPDTTKLGVAFVVLRKVDAQLGGGMWHADPQLCDAGTGRDLARLLAKLHALDPVKAEAPGALHCDPSLHPMRGLIDNIRQLWMGRRMEPDALLESCLCWLEENMPPVPSRLSLIHGDVSFHNILVRDKKIVSLLDWELSHLGDPLEDLSYCRLCIEQLMPWSEFLAEYRQCGGREYSEEAGQYYGVWRSLRNTVYAAVCRHSFYTDANLDLRWGFFATYYRMTLVEAAEKIARAGWRLSYA